MTGNGRRQLQRIFIGEIAEALESAGAMADLYRAYPDLDRERYVPPAREATIPAALARPAPLGGGRRDRTGRRRDPAP